MDNLLLLLKVGRLLDLKNKKTWPKEKLKKPGKLKKL